MFWGLRFCLKILFFLFFFWFLHLGFLFFGCSFWFCFGFLVLPAVCLALPCVFWGGERERDRERPSSETNRDQNFTFGVDAGIIFLISGAKNRSLNQLISFVLLFSAPKIVLHQLIIFFPQTAIALGVRRRRYLSLGT